MARTLLICLFLSLLALFGVHSSIAAEPDRGHLMAPGIADNTVLASVGDDQITVSQFRREMAVRGGGIPGQFATTEQRRALLDHMIQYRAMVARARAEGYDKDPDVIAISERAMVGKFQRDQLVDPRENLDVSDEEVAAYYAKHRADYDRPERSKAAIIFFKASPLATEEKKQELRERVQQALNEAKALDPSITHFGPVARKYSEDRASRYVGGVIGWLIKYPNRQYKWELPVVEAVFSLSQPGQIAPVIHTDRGFYLVRLVDRETASPRPFEQVKNGIRHQLMRSRTQQLDQTFGAGVLAGVDIHINQDILSGIEAPITAAETVKEQRPPRLPAG